MDAYARHAARSTVDMDNCFVVYDYAGEHSAGDSVSVELSSDGTSWSTLRSHTGNVAGATRAISLGPSWWGLEAVHLRFRIQTDASGVDEGGLIDDVSLRCESYVNPFAQLAGTSMSSPHVAGVAGLLFSQRPSASVAEVRAALLETTDALPSFAGLTVTGGRLSAGRALARFAAPAPGPPEAPPVAPPEVPADAPDELREPPRAVTSPATSPLALARAFRRLLAARSPRTLPARPRLAFRYRSRARGTLAAELLGPRGRGAKRPLLGRGATRFRRPATRKVTLALTRRGASHFARGRRRGLVLRVTFRPLRGRARTATVRVRLR